jgi:hypothetical protein
MTTKEAEREAISEERDGNRKVFRRCAAGFCGQEPIWNT